jgi:phage protein U
MMMGLGNFVFELKTIPYQSQQRTSNYRLAEHLSVGGKPSYQPMGEGEDVQTLEGILYPEYTGDELSLDELRTMMNAGEPYLMIDGNGYVRGYWYIESIGETKKEFHQEGTPKKIEFTITLKNSYETRI